MFEVSALIGISSGGKVKLKPSMDYVIKGDDKVITILLNRLTSKKYDHKII